jgi:hypothetical protein
MSDVIVHPFEKRDFSINTLLSNLFWGDVFSDSSCLELVFLPLSQPVGLKQELYLNLYRDRPPAPVQMNGVLNLAILWVTNAAVTGRHAVVATWLSV